MKKGSLLIIMFLFSILATSVTIQNSVTNVDEKPEAKATYSWVFMVYLDGDNNLESAAIDDFLEMSSVGSTSQVAVITLFDRWTGVGDTANEDDESYGNWTTAKLYYVDYGEEPYASNADADWGERDMGSPQTLYDFVSYVIEKYPATHYALVLWDHGGGIYGSAQDMDNGGDLLEGSELLNALQAVWENYHIKIDILGMDMCLMGLLETAYKLWDYVDYIVFSEELEPGDGWPYDDILNYLTSNPTVDPATLASKIVEYYIASYYSIWGVLDENVTLSAINLTALKYAIPKLNNLVGYLLRNYAVLEDTIASAVANAETFGAGYGYEFQKDLLHFLLLLNNSVTDDTLINLITETYNAFNDSIIANGHYNGHPNAYGLAIAFNGTDLSLYYYEQLTLSVEQQWSPFVSKLMGYHAELWFYNITLSGVDMDYDGYYDSDLTLTVDLDTDYGPMNVSVHVYAFNGSDYIYMGSSPYFVVDGATSSDAMSFSIYLLPENTYQLKIVIVDDSSSPRIIKSYGLYLDDDLINVRLEANDKAPPTVTILSPENLTEIQGLTVTIELNITDDIGVTSVDIYVNDTLIATFDGPISQVTITFENYGWYAIGFVAHDVVGKIGYAILLIKLVEQTQQEENNTQQGGGTQNNLPIDMNLVAMVIVITLILVALILIAKRKE